MIISITPKHYFVYDGAVISIYHANKNEGLPKHEHKYAHATFCVNGSCVIRKNKGEFVFTKETQPANLKAGEWHEIEALEDNTVFINVFAEGKQ